MRPPDRYLLVALGGAALLAGLSIAALPFDRGLRRVPRTPYDAGDADFIAPAWVLLRRAEAIVPPGASVVLRIEPPNPVVDSHFHRFAVALLPGRRVVPAARWNVPSGTALLREAQYDLVVGSPPADAPGRLLLEIPEGRIFRRGS